MREDCLYCEELEVLYWYHRKVMIEKRRLAFERSNERKVQACAMRGMGKSWMASKED